MNRLIVRLCNKDLVPLCMGHRKGITWKVAGYEQVFMTQMTGDLGRRFVHNDNITDKPIKFTSSSASSNYKSTVHFYGGDEDDGRPPSHNYFIAFPLLFGIYYLIWFRDNLEDEGFKSMVKPLHETVIPILKAKYPDRYPREVAAYKDFGIKRFDFIDNNTTTTGNNSNNKGSNSDTTNVDSSNKGLNKG